MTCFQICSSFQLRSQGILPSHRAGGKDIRYLKGKEPWERGCSSFNLFLHHVIAQPRSQDFLPFLYLCCLPDIKKARSPWNEVGYCTGKYSYSF